MVAEVCEHSLRSTDVIGRFAGEEFVVALPNTSPSAAQTLAERLKKNVAELQLEHDMNDVDLSITVGIAVSHNDESDLEALISRADEMLYIGKRDGRNRVVIHKD
ncbi:GGDEF domain-containing protein [Pseudidiomarina planktonica]|nr:GGDEF domain-containing protein [Pseudidiomarina planktonica]